jgi:hypothetical protein
VRCGFAGSQGSCGFHRHLIASLPGATSTAECSVERHRLAAAFAEQVIRLGCWPGSRRAGYWVSTCWTDLFFLNSREKPVAQRLELAMGCSRVAIANLHARSQEGSTYDHHQATGEVANL